MRQLKLGGPLTQEECDTGLAMLAAAGLPRASTGGQAGVVRALYLELLRDAGVTGDILKAACKRIIMRDPPPGKTKFFPDPGQIAAECQEECEDRRRQLDALNGALALLGAPPPAPEPEVTDEVIQKRRAEFEAASAKLSTKPSLPTSRPASASSARRVSASEILASRDSAAVERLRNITKSTEQA